MDDQPNQFLQIHNPGNISVSTGKPHLILQKMITSSLVTVRELGNAEEDLEEIVKMGKQLYKNKARSEENRQAIEFFLRAAKKGNSEAQYLMFKWFRRLRSVHPDDWAYQPKDYIEEISWLEKAATADYPLAQVDLGLWYMFDEEGGLNQKLGLEWIHNAAIKLNFAEAKYELGRLCELGFGGVEMDQRQANEWLWEAAIGGSVNARNWLGYGSALKEFESSLVGSYFWLKLASAAGHKKAFADLADVKLQMSSSELHLAQSLYEDFLAHGQSRSWFK